MLNTVKIHTYVQQPVYENFINVKCNHEILVLKTTRFYNILIISWRIRINEVTFFTQIQENIIKKSMNYSCLTVFVNHMNSTEKSLLAQYRGCLLLLLWTVNSSSIFIHVFNQIMSQHDSPNWNVKVLLVYSNTKNSLTVLQFVDFLLIRDILFYWTLWMKPELSIEGLLLAF